MSYLRQDKETDSDSNATMFGTNRPLPAMEGASAADLIRRNTELDNKSVSLDSSESVSLDSEIDDVSDEENARIMEGASATDLIGLKTTEPELGVESGLVATDEEPEDVVALAERGKRGVSLADDDRVSLADDDRERGDGSDPNPKDEVTDRKRKRRESVKSPVNDEGHTSEMDEVEVILRLG